MDKFKLLLTGGLLAATASLSFAAQGPAVNLYGTATVNGKTGLYKISACGGDLSVVRLDDKLSASGGGTLIQDKTYFFTNHVVLSSLIDIDYQYKMSMASDGSWGKPEYISGVREAYATSMATDPTTNIVWGCTGTSSPYTLSKINNENPSEITQVSKNVLTAYNAMGFSSDGTLYAMRTDGIFVKINKANGEETKIGDTQLASALYTSGTLDKTTGTFYYIHATADGRALYSISLTDAKATKIYNIPENIEIDGMFTIKPDCEAKAPGFVTDITPTSTTNPNASKFTFNLPSKAFDGSALNGQISYTVTLSGQAIAEGSAAAGNKIEVPVSVSTTGTYEFVITTSNSTGKGPESYISIFLGNEAPMPVKNAHLTRNGTTNTVTWTANGLSVKGNDLDVNNLRYKIVRMPDNVTVAPAHQGTTFTEILDEPTKPIRLCYIITPLNGAIEGESVSTDYLAIGNIVPPYIENFNDYKLGLGDMTIIDNNHDGSTWYWYGNAAYTQFQGRQKDEYLITPPLRLEKGRNYQLQFMVGAILPDAYTDNIEVIFGKAPTVEGLDKVILDKTLVSNKFDRSNPVRLSTNVTPEEDGVYYIGFHSVSDNGYQLAIDDINFIAPIEVGAPVAPANFEVKANEDGYNKASASIQIPDKDTKGATLDKIEKAEIWYNDVLVHTFTNPTPGSTVTHEFNVPSSALYEFRAMAYNDHGVGSEAYCSTYIGVKLPVAPTNGHIVETENPGEVTVTWDAPTTDVEKRALNPELVTYTIFDANNQLIEDNYVGTTMTVQAASATSHTHVGYTIYANTEIGRSETGVQSGFVAVGRAFPTPYAESFAGNSPAGWTLISTSNYAFWTLGYRVKVDEVDVYPYDEDEGVLYSFAMTEGLEATARTGKISLEGLEKPGLNFSYYAAPSGYDELTVSILSEGTDNVLETFQIRRDDLTGWQRIGYPLDQFKGKNIQASFTMLSWSSLCPIIIDKVCIGELEEGAIDNIANDESGIVISTTDGMITVIGAEGSAITVANSAGMSIFTTASAAEYTSINVAPGIYVVKAAEKVAKVIVR